MKMQNNDNLIYLIESEIKNILYIYNWSCGKHKNLKSWSYTVWEDFNCYIDNFEENISSSYHYAKEFIKCFSGASNSEIENNIENNKNDIVNEIVTLIDNKVKQNSNLKKKEEKQMSRKKSSKNSKPGLVKKVLNTAISDSKEILIRTSARQLSKTIVEPMTALLLNGLQLEDNESTRSKIGNFLNSDIGRGIISFGLSFGVKMLPLPTGMQDLSERIGNELRLQGEMAISEPFVEMFAAPARMLLTEQILALPIAKAMAAEKQLTSGTPEVKVVNDIGKEQNEKTNSVKKVVKRSRVKKNDQTIKVEFKEIIKKEIGS